MDVDCSVGEAVNSIGVERMDMEAGEIAKKSEETTEEVVKCISCDRTLKNASEAIRSRKSAMCVSCYESLLNPFPKCCNGGALL